MRLFTLLLVLFCLSVVNYTYAQAGYCPPPNVGFERGNFDNWECDTGKIGMDGTINVISCDPADGRQTMYSSSNNAELDPYGSFPTLCPNGSGHSIRLGNNERNAGAERVAYTFNIPAGANEYDLIFNYAVVFQNPHHADYEQPRFTVKTFDVTDNTYVECASFDFIASANLPGFKRAPVIAKADTEVYYKGWSPSTIHLQGYAGKQIRLEFTTNDCTRGGHFGYAYVDVNEDCSSPITGNAYCTGEKSLTLFAPGGFGSYTWYTGDLSTILGAAAALTLKPAPQDGATYAVVLRPFNGLGCIDTLYTTINKIQSGFSFVAVDTIYACANSSVDITAPAITAGSSDNLTLAYYTDPNGIYYLAQPKNITTSGTYYIKAVSPAGCSNILPVQIIIGNPIVDAKNPPAVNYPQSVDISATFTHYQINRYSYFTNSELTTQVADYQHIVKTGIYYIKATGPAGCITVVPVYIVVVPPPPPVVKAVNTFTPNNDGVNDYFSVSIIGYGEFGSLRVYDRYGRLIFQTLSQDGRWDGKYNETPVNTGTYYWVFEGRNTYYNSKVVESGFIALIR
jgi:gliding motility-associated-like protein